MKLKPVLLGIVFALLFIVWICSFMLTTGTGFHSAMLMNRHTSYFLEQEFEVTEKNFSQCTKDLLAVPRKLFYSLNHNGQSSTVFYCDKITKNKKVADAFQDLNLVPTTRNHFDTIWQNTYDVRIKFMNQVGAIRVAVKDGKSYVCFETHTLETSNSYYEFSIIDRFCFSTEKDLTNDLLGAKKILDSDRQSTEDYVE